MTIDTDRYIIDVNKPYKYSLKVEKDIEVTRQLINTYETEFSNAFKKQNIVQCQSIILEMFDELEITSVAQAQKVLKLQNDAKTFKGLIYDIYMDKKIIDELIANNLNKYGGPARLAKFYKDWKQYRLILLWLANIYDEPKYLNEKIYTPKCINYIKKSKITNGGTTISSLIVHHLKHIHDDDLFEIFCILICDKTFHDRIHAYYGKTATAKTLINDISPIFNETNYEIKRKLMIEFIEKWCGKNWLHELKNRFDNF
jgi:hypothetical protein